MAVVQEDMRSAGANEKDAEDGVRWRQTTHCGGGGDGDGEP